MGDADVEISARKNARMPCINSKTVHRRLTTQDGANRVFLTQGDRSREVTNVSLKAPSPTPQATPSFDDLEDEILEPERPKLDVDDIKRRLYQKECTRVGVTPVGKFLRSPTQTEISIRYYNLGSGGARALSVPLMLDSTMTKLDLEGNAIGDAGIANMAEMLEDHCSITTMENRVLKHLDLSENSLGDASGKALGDALSQNETLERLDLAWNKFRGNGAAKLLDGVKENFGLKWLNLSFNSLSRGPFKTSRDALGNALAGNSTLEHIELSSTQLHDLDMLGVARALKGNESLNTMKIGRNMVQVQSISAILRSLVMNDSSKITLLDMENMAIEQGAVEDIETLRSRGVEVIHGPVHQTETSFSAMTSAPPAAKSDGPEEEVNNETEETTNQD